MPILQIKKLKLKQVITYFTKDKYQIDTSTQTQDCLTAKPTVIILSVRKKI